MTEIPTATGGAHDLKKLSRAELVDRLAFERAEYELDVEARGYSEAAFQPIIPFIKDATFRLARTHKIARVQTSELSPGVRSNYASVDWKRLAKDVERRTISFRRDIQEFGS